MTMVRLGLAMTAGVALCSAGAMGVSGAVAQPRQQPQERPEAREQAQPGLERGAQQPGRERETRARRPQRAPGGGGVTPDLRRTLANHNADVNSQLSSENAPRLTQAWRVQTEANVTHAPLLDSGRVYFADWGGNVYCVEQESGEEVWKKKLGEPNQEWPWHGFVGTGSLSEGGETLFLASAEGTAYAIDTESGETIWEREITEQEHAGSTGRVLHHDGLVFIGLSSVEEFLHGEREGFEPSFRGAVMALDARSGETVWDAQLVQEPSNGVAVWGGFALDPDTRTLYFATGNNYTGEPSALSNAVLAVDAGSGELIWAQQTTPNDVWTRGNPQGPGFAFKSAPQLFNAVIGGERRRLVGAGQKSGMFWAWDRRSGEALWATPVGYGHIGGGIFGEASIGRDRIIIAGNNAYAFENPDQHPLDIKAVDPRSGRPLWVKSRAQPAQLTSSGFLASDVYFAASLDGKVRAYNAESGEEVWTSGEHASIASPIRVEGEMVCFGTGLPAALGGKEGEGRGVFCYRIAAPGAEATARPREGAGEAEVQPAANRLRQEQAERRQRREGAAPQPGDRVEAEQIRLTAKGTAFEPGEVRVRPGQAVTILFINSTDGPRHLEFQLPDGQTAKLEQPVAANQQHTLTFVAPRAPGRYTFICPAGGDAAPEMKGTLVVAQESEGHASEER